MQRTTDEILMRRYFLGDLPQEERDRLEDRYFADVEVFEELLAIENDLIDAYARGELTEGDRRKFEVAYLQSPPRRERVEFARALRLVSALEAEAVGDQRGSLWKRMWAALSIRQGISQWALAIAVVLIVASGSWMLVQNQKLRVGLQQAQAGQAELLREENTLRQQIAEFKGAAKDQVRENQKGSEVAKLEPPMGLEMTLRLIPGIARGFGGAPKTLVLLPTTSWLRLQLMVDRDEDRTYEAVLLTADGKEVSRGRDLRIHSMGGSTVVAWRIPAQSIQATDYIVQLTGQPAAGMIQEGVESYSFRVLRR
jgi:hypothetical protein